MKPTVYVETTIPSYYWDDRPELRAQIERTREWWDHERQDYECFVSAVVMDELRAGSYRRQPDCVALVTGLPLLATAPEVLDIAEVYQLRRLMPTDPAADSLHLALASYYRLDYLLTWNCRHLANANKARHFEVLNQGMGLHVPLLVTPYMLQPWEDPYGR